MRLLLATLEYLEHVGRWVYGPPLAAVAWGLWRECRDNR